MQFYVSFFVLLLLMILGFSEGQWMDSTSFPLSLALLSLSLSRTSTLSRAVNVVLMRMRTRYPRLFKNLEQLPPAKVYIEPIDLSHRFILEIGQAPVLIRVVKECSSSVDAHISGSLESLVAMLEGKVDGDTLFFSRDITITGNTAVVVALRNTLDREEINILDSIISLCGPFANSAKNVITSLDWLVGEFRTRVQQFHNGLHNSKFDEGATRDG
jgi:predicted lipid carrier protein YhbT